MLATALVLVAIVAPAPLLRPEVLAEVAARAPVVEASEARVEATQAAIGVAGSWEDARFSIMAEGLPLPGGGHEDPVMIDYRLAQPLNLFGRRRAARLGAAARVDGARAGLRRVSWDARAAAVALFYELWMNGEMDRVMGEQIALLERMRETGLARVRAGMDMGHHDVLRAEAQVAVMQAERASLADERQAMSAMLNVLRGRPPDQELGAPLLPALASLPALDHLDRRADATPEVDQARAMGREAAAGVALARRMYWPMVMVEGAYQQNLDGMPDALGVGVSISVPLAWRDRQDRELAMARAMARAAEREASAMRTMAGAELRMAWSRARAAERKVDALEQVALPRLRETIVSIESAYIAGRSDFLPLLDAVMQLQALEGERIAATAQRGVARFELDRIAGDEVSP